MKRAFSLLFILWAAQLLFAGEVYGQTNNVVDLQKIIPPSPTSASLGKYAEWPVSLFTGVPGISVPLYELKGRSLSVPITLNYHASGIRVGEVASNVGLGWSLSAGGVITRSVRGIADENIYGGYLAFRQHFGNPQDISEIDSNFSSMNDLMNQALKGTWDTQPDEWMFNALGHSYSFFFNGQGKIVTQPYSNVKITSDFPNNRFTVILEDGTKLIFGDSCTETTQGSFNSVISGANSFISSWYLHKIISTTGEVITFNYNTEHIVHTGNFSETDYLPYSISGGGKSYGSNQPCPCTNPAWPFGDIVKYEYQNVIGKSLASIESDLGIVYFDKDSSGRQDNPGDTAITALRVYSKLTNRIIKEYHLAYTYSSATGGSIAASGSHPEEATRLKLSTVGEYVPGTGSLVNQWKMYYNSLSLPARSSFAQDHWGYYNGAINSTLLPVEAHFLSSDGFSSGSRWTDPASAQAEMLTRITYPTGGSSKFTFESNSYPDSVEQFSTTFVSSEIDDLDSGSTIHFKTTFTIPYTQNITFSIFGSYSAKYKAVHSGCSEPHANLLNSSNTVLTTVQVCTTGTSNTQITLDAGTYTIDLVRDLIRDPTDDGDNMVRAFLNYQSSLGMQPYTHMAGGLRIKSIEYTDSINTANNNIQVFQYDQPFVIAPVDSAKDYITDYTESCNSGEATGSIYALIRSSTSKFCLGAIQGGTVGYGKVTVLSGLNGENGKTENYFSTTPNPTNIFTRKYPYAPATNRDWARGLPLAKYTYDNTGRLVASQKDIYGPIDKDYITAIKLGSNPLFTGNTTSGMLIPGLVTVSYDIITDQIVHTQSIQTTYSSTGSDSISVVKNFYYDNPDYMQPTRSQEFNSKGDTITTITNCALDSIGDLSATAKQAQDSMVARNMVSIPLEMTQTNNSRLMSKVKYNFKVWPSNLVLPESIEQQIANNPIEKRVQYGAYTSSGKLVTQQKSVDVLQTFIWDYQNNYPIAEIINADSSSVAYTSFESGATGNWTVGSTSHTSPGITGDSSFSLNSNISKTGLSSSRTYFVSYWTLNSSPFSIAGTVSGYPTKGKAVNGWTLYIHKIMGQSTISINGSGKIDELRLYPIEAQMTTYTYLPLVGMTSACDVGSRITYYEYDAVQRLKRIRDQDYNIIKSVEYQYQVSSGCGTNCYILTMHTLAGTNTLGYPVGVFNINGKLLGNASNPSQYVNLWNIDTADNRIGALALGGDSLHFNITLNTGQILPNAVTGCRYYQVDLAWNQYDGLRNSNAAYVDFGDNKGIRLPSDPTRVATIPDSTTYGIANSGEENANVVYYIHTYRDTSLKTITFYHNDDGINAHLDNFNAPATSLMKLKHYRGNLPQNLNIFGGSCYQQPSMTSIDSIYNWSSLHNITYVHWLSGDGVDPCKNMSYAQDFMANNKGLRMIRTTLGAYRNGYRDTTFKLSRLKSDWNTYFTNLQSLVINEDHWSHEDLTQLKQLNYFVLEATTQNHQDDTNSPLVSIDGHVLDSVIIQIANGAGQTVSNGTIALITGGGTLSDDSQASAQLLLSKGWTILVNGVALTNP